MSGTICFTAGGNQTAEVAGRHRAATTALHRYLPHVVEWGCARPGAPISLVLPESLSARELVQRASKAYVQVAAGCDADAPDRVIEIHYAHLADAEIDEGLRRLGRCLVHELMLAMGSTSSSFYGL